MNAGPAEFTALLHGLEALEREAPTDINHRQNAPGFLRLLETVKVTRQPSVIRHGFAASRVENCGSG